jgi:iron-sulfur cluster assembly protein
MAIKLTQPAAEHVSKMLQQRGSGLGLRLGTKQYGCTGFAYVVDYADEINEDDVTFDTRGIKVIVSSDQLQKLDGMTIDFQKNNMLNKGFDFINPNAKDMCGCGESFSV